MRRLLVVVCLILTAASAFAGGHGGWPQPVNATATYSMSVANPTLGTNNFNVHPTSGITQHCIGNPITGLPLVPYDINNNAFTCATGVVGPSQ